MRRHPPHHLSPAKQTTRQGAIPWGASGHPSRYSNAPIEDESQSFLSKWSPEGPKSRLPFRGFGSHDALERQAVAGAFADDAPDHRKRLEWVLRHLCAYLIWREQPNSILLKHFDRLRQVRVRIGHAASAGTSIRSAGAFILLIASLKPPGVIRAIR